MKRKILILLLTIVWLSAICFPCMALREEPVYAYDPNGTSIPAPVSYKVKSVLYGKDVGVDNLWNPEDLYTDADGFMYIADTGNDRIVVLNSRFGLHRIIDKVWLDKEQSSLSHPKGVFKAADGLLYICDTENRRVIGIDKDQKVVRHMTGDDLIVVNENIDFRPEKVAVSDDGTVYVVASDIYQGIIQYGSNNQFNNFFAPNDVEVTADVLVLNMWKNLFSAEQQDAMEKTLPAPYNNIFMSKDRLLYTTASNVKVGDEIKCMNSLGVNILRTPQYKNGGAAFGDLEVSYENNEYVKSRFIDVHADETAMFCALDATRNRLFQYDKECNLISIFGGIGTQEGQFSKAVAVDKLGDCYLVLDGERGSITVFEPTAYTKDVLQALTYYNKGLYVESVEKWQNILKQNSNFAIAYRSIGRAYLQEGKSKQAMEMLKKGEDKYYYSLALKEYRKEFTRGNLLWMIGLVIVLVVGIIWTGKYIRKKLIS